MVGSAKEMIKPTSLSCDCHVWHNVSSVHCFFSSKEAVYLVITLTDDVSHGIEDLLANEEWGIRELSGTGH